MKEIEKQKKYYRIYADWLSFLDLNNPFLEYSYLLSMASESKIALVKSVLLRNYKLHEDEMKKEYEKSIDLYKSILNNFHELVKELEIYDDLDVSLLCTYLIWNGYFSYGKELKYDTNKLMTIPGLLSFDIFRGIGTCITFANLLADCLNECKIKAAAINCGTPLKVKADYLPRIQRKQNDNLLNSVKSNIAGIALYPITRRMNHVITLVDNDGKYYAFDPTNLLLLNIDNNLNASIVNGLGKFRLSPCSTIITRPSADRNYLMNKLFDGKREEVYNKEDSKSLMEPVLDVIDSNVHLLNDFYKENEIFYETISDEMIKYGNGLRKK